MVRLGRIGTVLLGLASIGWAGQGVAGKASLVTVRRGSVRLVSVWQERYGAVWSGKPWTGSETFGLAGVVWCSRVVSGSTWSGMAGKARHVMVSFGTAG